MQYAGGPSGWANAWTKLRQEIAAADNFDRHIAVFWADGYDGDLDPNLRLAIRWLATNPSFPAVDQSVELNLP